MDTEKTNDEPKSLFWRTLPYLQGIASLYCFFLGLAMIGNSMKVMSGPSVNAWFAEIKGDPIQGLACGILVTVLVQSSSTTTSITVVLVALGNLTVDDAIPVIWPSGWDAMSVRRAFACRP